MWDNVADSIECLKNSLNHLSLGLVRAESNGSEVSAFRLAYQRLAEMPKQNNTTSVLLRQACAHLANAQALGQMAVVHTCLQKLSQGIEAQQARADLEDWLAGDELTLAEDIAELPDLDLDEELLAGPAEVFLPAVVSATIQPPSAPPEAAPVQPPVQEKRQAYNAEKDNQVSLPALQTGSVVSAETYFAALPWQAACPVAQENTTAPVIETFRIQPSAHITETFSGVNPIVAATQHALITAQRLSQAETMLATEDWLALECENFFRQLPWQNSG